MFTNSIHQKAHEVLQKGNIEEAIILYTQALDSAPNDVNILSDRGVAYLHADDFSNCFKDLDKAIELQPDYSYRYACRAFAKNHFKDLEGAVKDYQKAIELDPNDAVAQNNYGLLLEQQGYKKEAEKRFEKADKLSEHEDKLYNLVDDLEAEKTEEVKESDVTEPTNLTTDEVEESSQKMSKEIKKIFTSKQQLNDFLRFIKNGFKIK